jgi:diguanylate cyclase (GGDEF)-like protein
MKKLFILILEDIPAHAEIAAHEIKKMGIDFRMRRVETKEEFEKEIEDCSPDVILADYSLPSFDGISALKIALIKCPKTPFIFVSGAIGEERAIETLKAGATDYILKDNMKRLGSSILRALAEREERRKRERAEESLEYQAFHDGLTRLPNRRALEERFAAAREIAVRQKKKMAVLFLDLDRFKAINDTMGHRAGDLLLKEMAIRLTSAVRKEDIVSRWGGDEFVVLATDLSLDANIGELAEKILLCVKKPMRIGREAFAITVSIGMAIFPDDGDDISSLLMKADTALHSVKKEGRNKYRAYDPQMNTHLYEKFQLEGRLREAINLGEIVPYFQPMFDRQGSFAGAEALARWNHAGREPILPEKFIMLAEETGQIISLGTRVMKDAAVQYRQWLSVGLSPSRISVNVSSRQFSEDDFLKKVAGILEESGLDPKFLEIEITESVAMENTASVLTKLNALKQMGVNLSIDDFGTGYSSLSYLKRFPFSRLKIDKSFVDTCVTNESDAAVVMAIISLGQALSLEIIAEGVETKAQFSFLRSLGCGLFQGYYFSKPLPAGEFAQVFKKFF